MVYLNIIGFGGSNLVLSPTVDTYEKYGQFGFLSASKCYNFELTTRTLCILVVKSNSR